MRFPEIRLYLGYFLVLMTALLLSASGALAQVASDDQKCINEVNKNFAKVAKAQGKDICKCIKDGSKGKLVAQSIEECLTADNKGKVLKAKNKLLDKVASKCVSPPPFGPTDPDLANETAMDKELNLIHDIFGSDLDAVINDFSVDKVAAKCQSDVAKQAKKCQDTHLKVYNKCKKNGLKDGSITDASGLEACVGDDPKNKASKECDTKLAKKISKKCGGVASLAAAFPGCGTDDAGELKTCIDEFVRCQVCKALDVVDDLSRDCDDFDDAVDNDSCTFVCGNGAVEPGEPCDDGNLVNGDGCSDTCTVEAGYACTGNASDCNLFPEARLITDPNDLIGGLLARGRVGDYLIQNDEIRVIVQKPQRNYGGVGQFGGQLIDADVRRNPEPGRDLFEEWAVLINVENTAHYTSVVVLNDGTDGNPAVIRATGVDDLLDFVNPSSIVADFGFSLPSTVDDTDLPVEVTTDYSVDTFGNYVRIDTTITNVSGSETIETFVGDYLSSLAQEVFHAGYGFGEPLVTTENDCDAGVIPCDFIAYAGEGDQKSGVSYGYVHTVPGSTHFNTDGVQAFLLGVNTLLVLLGVDGPNVMLAPSEDFTFTRYLVVGDGDVAAIVDARNEIQGLSTGTLRGKVTETGGAPVADAEVAVLADPNAGPGTDENVVSQFRTDPNGNFEGTLPPADYEVRVNKKGYLLASPDPANISLAADQTVTQNFTFAEPGTLRVTIEDPNGDPIAGKVSIVGFDPSPDPGNFQDVLDLGVVLNNTGIFGRDKDPQHYGVETVVFVDDGGDSGEFSLEPGSYQIVVSHGTEFSIHEEDVTLSSGGSALVEATVARVINTDGFISADMHVHSLDSTDCPITRRDRIISMLAEGVDFFTPSDHGFRIDFTDDIANLGVADLIGTAVNNEITTFDYGHFGGYPMTIDPNQVNGGAVDWGGAATVGEDFPSFGNYSLAPGEIYLEVLSDPGEDTVHVHHVASFFDGGLRFDTGDVPPTSNGDPGDLRLDPGITNFWDPNFTSLELWIQTSISQDSDFLDENAGNWFNLLNQGIVRTGHGSSDTHHLSVFQSGFPRSYIASPTDDPGALAAIAETLAANQNDGRLIATNGPFMRVTLEGDPNEVGGLELGMDTLVKATGGSATITVEIQSPTWAEFDTVEYYVNSETIKNTTGRVGLPPLYEICPEFVQTDPNDFTIASVMVNGDFRFEATATLELSGLTEDTWVVVMVKGSEDVSCPIFPVVPNDISESTNATLGDLKTCQSGDEGVTALAFSNPVFIDFDGNGDYDSPGVAFQGSCP